MSDSAEYFGRVVPDSNCVKRHTCEYLLDSTSIEDKSVGLYSGSNNCL